jgi:hypothetical protein
MGEAFVHALRFFEGCCEASGTAVEGSTDGDIFAVCASFLDVTVRLRAIIVCLLTRNCRYIQCWITPG